MQVYLLSKEEGGRQKPYTNAYQAQLFCKTWDAPAQMTLPSDKDMVMPGEDASIEFVIMKNMVCICLFMAVSCLIWLLHCFSCLSLSLFLESSVSIFIWQMSKPLMFSASDYFWGRFMCECLHFLFQTWGHIHWNLFKYKYSWGIQIHLNTNEFKYKYIGKYFKYFSFSGCFTMQIKERQLIYWDT